MTDIGGFFNSVDIGGFFNSVDDEPRDFLARLSADGSLDDDFAPNLNGEDGNRAKYASPSPAVSRWFVFNKIM